MKNIIRWSLVFVGSCPKVRVLLSVILFQRRVFNLGLFPFYRWTDVSLLYYLFIRLFKRLLFYLLQNCLLVGPAVSLLNWNLKVFTCQSSFVFYLQFCFHAFFFSCYFKRALVTRVRYALRPTTIIPKQIDIVWTHSIVLVEGKHL